MSKELVVPGELIGSESQLALGLNAYALEGNIFSSVLGLKTERDNQVSVVPLKGRYVPNENDNVIGIVKSEKFAGYEVEINSFYSSFVNKKDLRAPLKVGSLVSARIMKVNEMNEADIGFVRPLDDGEVVVVSPVRVPRIIGKNNSMLNVLKNGTGSTILVGRNGYVYVHGGNITLAKEALQRVNNFAHVENLTNDMQRFLAAKTGQGIPSAEGSSQDAFGEMPASYQGGYGMRRPYGDRGGFRPRGRFQGSGMGGGNRDRFQGNRSFPSNNRFPRNNFQRGNRYEANRGFGNNYNQNNYGQNPSFERRKRFPPRGDNYSNEDPDFD